MHGDRDAVLSGGDDHGRQAQILGGASSPTTDGELVDPARATSAICAFSTAVLADE